MKNWLHRMFPPPQLPQKRYIVMILAIYFAVKLYTMATPSTADDVVLEHVKDAALEIALGM